MDKKRIFRALVCFVLICVFLINTSPIRIRVEATVVDPVSVGAAAILMWYIATYMGVVFNPTTANLNSLWNTIQVDVPPAIYSYYDDEEAAAAAMDDWQRAMYNFDFSIYDDDDFDEPDDSDPGDSSEEVFDAEKSKWGFGFNKSNTIAIGAELGAFLVDYFANIAEQGGFKAFGEEAPSGCTFYGEHCLVTIPEPTENLPYSALLYGPTNSLEFYYYRSSSPFKVYPRSDGSWSLRSLETPYTIQNAVLSDASDDSWHVYSSTSPSSAVIRSLTDYSIVWTSHDIVDSTAQQNVIFTGSAATTSQEIIVAADMYFGDYPDQIEDGTFDSESVKIPVLDFSQLMETSAYAQEAARSMYNQIYNGQMSYNDYVDQIQADNSVVDPGGNLPDPGPLVPGPVDPSAPLPAPPPALGDYALDLRDFFPFCIPFDIYALLSLLAAAPETPHFEHTIYIPIIDYNWYIVVDLAPWDDLAAVVRQLELLAFIIGLGVATRNYYIRG